VHITAVGFGRGKVVDARKHDLGSLSSELPTRLGCARLHNDWPTLDRAGNVQRTTHLVILPFEIKGMHAVRIKINTRFDITDESVISKAIPKASDNIKKLAGTPVAFVMLIMFFAAEIEGFMRIGRSHDIPSRAAATDVV